MSDHTSAPPTTRQWAAWLAPLAVVFGAVLMLSTVPIFPTRPGPPAAHAAPLERLGNLSVRARVGPGSGALQVTLTVAEGGPREVYITAKGPSLVPLGVTQPLANPRVALLDASGKVLAENDDWNAAADPRGAQLAGAGRAPTHAAEAALSATVAAGTYVIRADGASGEGVVLLDVFSLDPGAPGFERATVRSRVSNGEGVVIAGFTVPNGPPRRLAIAARGPSLASEPGITPLSRPRLEIVAAAGPRLMAATEGASEPRTAEAIGRLTGRPLSERDAGVLTDLPPGAYMAILMPVAASDGGDAALEMHPRP